MGLINALDTCKTLILSIVMQHFNLNKLKDKHGSNPHQPVRFEVFNWHIFKQKINKIKYFSW